jgi:hypothetical protein
MLFDKNLTVPEIASAVQLKERPRPKVPNPYNALGLRKQTRENKVVDKPQQLPVWEPQMQVGKKVASILVSQVCFAQKMYTEHHALQMQKAGLLRRFRLPRFRRLPQRILASPAAPPPNGRASTCSRQSGQSFCSFSAPQGMTYDTPSC